MQLRGLIFDLDGTLADNLPTIYQAFRVAFSSVGGQHYTDAEIFDMFGPTEGAIFQQAMPGRWREALEAYRAAYAAALSSNSFAMPGIGDVLEWLSQQQKLLAVVTGADTWHAEHTLAALGLAQHFQVVRCGAPGRTKAENLRYVLQQWRMAPEHIGYVSDSPRDMEIAMDHGVVPLGASWARSTKADVLYSAGAVQVFDSPSGLLRWLQ